MVVKSRSVKRNAKNVRGLGRDRHFSRLHWHWHRLSWVNNRIVRVTKLDLDRKSTPRELYKMFKYSVYWANSKQWDRNAAIQKPQNLLRRKKTSGKVAGDTYSLSKFSSFFITAKSCLILPNLRDLETLKVPFLTICGSCATSFPGFSPTRPTERVGENPGNEVGSCVIHELVSSP